MAEAPPILVVGSGGLSRRIAGVLISGGYAPVLADGDADALREAALRGHAVAPITGPSYREALAGLLARHAAVIVAEPSGPAAEIAAVAAGAGCHYLDVLESPTSARAVAQVADGAPEGLAFAPGCGLAPGYVTALAAAEIDAAGPEAEITVFVGVLPKRPENRLGYANIWGVSGLIDEYTQPCVGLADGKRTERPPLTEREEVRIAGTGYEAFTTAGSLDALAESRAGQLRGLTFKTLRYPGHLDYIRFLLDDLGLSRQLYRLRSLLLSSLPHCAEDRVLIALRTRLPGGPPRWTEYCLESRAGPDGTESAIATATAAHAGAVLDLVMSGRSEGRGLLAPGMVPLARLRDSRFFDLLAPVLAGA